MLPFFLHRQERVGIAGRADGRELFYGARGGKLLSVEVGPNGDFGPPKDILQVRGARDYAVAPDGQRFLVIERPRQEAVGLLPVKRRFVVGSSS